MNTRDSFLFKLIPPEGQCTYIDTFSSVCYSVRWYYPYGHSPNQGGSSMINTEITLPDAETMMARLKEVTTEPDTVKKFYPLLTKYAGQVRVPEGVVMMLQTAIYEHTADLPITIVVAFNMSMNDYIDALVIDKTAAHEAKAHWTKVRELMRTN